LPQKATATSWYEFHAQCRRSGAPRLPDLRYNVSHVALSRNMGRLAERFRWRKENKADEMRIAKGIRRGNREAMEGRKNPRQKV